MARPRRKIRSGPLSLSNEDVSGEESLRVIENLLDTLSVAQLRRVRVLVGRKQQEKLAEAKDTVLREVEGRVKAMGLSMKDVFPSHTSSRKAPLPVKYRSPSGETWSGKGRPPGWLRRLEAEGQQRETFRVSSEVQPSLRLGSSASSPEGSY